MHVGIDLRPDRTPTELERHTQRRRVPRVGVAHEVAWLGVILDDPAHEPGRLASDPLAAAGRGPDHVAALAEVAAGERRREPARLPTLAPRLEPRHRARAGDDDLHRPARRAIPEHARALTDVEERERREHVAAGLAQRLLPRRDQVVRGHADEPADGARGPVRNEGVHVLGRPVRVVDVVLEAGDRRVLSAVVTIVRALAVGRIADRLIDLDVGEHVLPAAASEVEGHGRRGLPIAIACRLCPSRFAYQIAMSSRGSTPRR